MRTTLPALLLPVLLFPAACQQGADTGAAATGNTAAAQPAGYSPLQQRLLGLAKGQQDGVLFRAIRDGKAPCQGVEETHRQPDQDGAPLFVATCTDGPVYAISVDRAGVAQVTRVSGERR